MTVCPLSNLPSSTRNSSSATCRSFTARIGSRFPKASSRSSYETGKPRWLQGDGNEKLSWLEQEYEAAKLRSNGNPAVLEWTLRSLKQTINQLKEEIIRFESHADSPAPS